MLQFVTTSTMQLVAKLLLKFGFVSKVSETRISFENVYLSMGCRFRSIEGLWAFFKGMAAKSMLYEKLPSDSESIFDLNPKTF